MDINALVKLITEEVLKELERQNKPRGKALLLFTGAAIGFAEALESIKRLKPSLEMTAFLSKSAEYVLTKEVLATQLDIPVVTESVCTSLFPLYRGVDYVIVPSFTMNSLSKTALGICDTAITSIISHCLMEGIPVIAASNACDIEDPERLAHGMNKSPGAYISLYKTYIKMCESYGIVFAKAGELDLCVSGFCKKTPQETKKHVVFDKKVLSRNDLMQYTEDGKMFVTQDAIITDLARETAIRHNIQIIRA